MLEVGLLRDIVAIIGVFIGLSYYIMNLREIRRNRRITLTTDVLQPFQTKEGFSNILDLLGMEWTSLEDFTQKYDHRVNPDNSAARIAMWNKCESIGMLYKEGLLDLETLFGGSQGAIVTLWVKFEPIIEMYRESDLGPMAYQNFEVIAEKLMEYMKLHGEPEAQERVIREVWGRST
jgi:hypothetical protein